jgi:putative endopeptidase
MKLPVLIFLVIAGCALAEEPPRSNFDRANMDPTCKPCDDFWRYVNGGWLDKNPIPARYSSWGSFQVLREGNRERLRTILEAGSTQKAAAGSNARKVGDFYASCMDTAAIETRGTKPLEPFLARIAAISSPKELSAQVAALSVDGATGVFAVFSGQDLKNSKEVIANVGARALSLPDRDYYFKDDPKSKDVRNEFVKHVARMLELMGDKPEAAAAAAAKILAFETSIAEATMTNVQRRDPYARYHKMDFAALASLTPDFDWKPLFGGLGVSETAPINVGEPEVLKKMNLQLTKAPLEDWKMWLRWRVVKGSAEYLSKAFVDEDFAFDGSVLTGVTEQLPRWQKCTDMTDRSLGDPLGELFVKKYFPPDAKRRMNELVENLRVTLREELAAADWLEPATREAAVAKLNAFVPKIGYPDHWRDYSAVSVSGDHFFENILSTNRYSRAYNLAKIGKPVDRNDWGMTPPTVNAYYSPVMNEIAFPAGILQFPFFDMTADDALNYGAIGAVIGHEMGHGFDDQGSKFDAEGNLKNWWTPADRKKFEERAACVINEFDTLDVGNGQHHNGKLVVGEAMGDLGGLKLAYKAWQRSLKGKPAPAVMDGFTPEQRFFLAFTRVWGAEYRAEAVRLQLNTNPHPLPHFRANGTLQNMPEFHKAFGCKQGDPMVRPEASQCKLW